jgi:hypothetical protein
VTAALLEPSCSSDECMGTGCVLMEITLGHIIRPIQHSIYSTRGMAPDRAMKAVT